MATQEQIDIGNLELHPGDIVEFDFLEVGNAASVALALKSIKGALANDARWSYQGFQETDQADGRHATVYVQIRKDYGKTVGGNFVFAQGIVPIVPLAVVGLGALIAYVAASKAPWVAAIIEAHITARTEMGEIRAIWNNPNLPVEQKREATAAIQGAATTASKTTDHAVTANAVAGTSSAVGFGLVLVGGVLLFALLSGKLT
jgi:hypothetical protein